MQEEQDEQKEEYDDDDCLLGCGRRKHSPSTCNRIHVHYGVHNDDVVHTIV